MRANQWFLLSLVTSSHRSGDPWSLKLIMKEKSTKASALLFTAARLVANNNGSEALTKSLHWALRASVPLTLPDSKLAGHQFVAGVAVEVFSLLRLAANEKDARGSAEREVAKKLSSIAHPNQRQIMVPIFDKQPEPELIIHLVEAWALIPELTGNAETVKQTVLEATQLLLKGVAGFEKHRESALQIAVANGKVGDATAVGGKFEAFSNALAHYCSNRPAT
jgi:hypothetical protein